MYLHLGNDKMIKSNSVIGIFDLDNATISKRTRNYLNKAEKKGEVETVGYDLPKTFVVCADKRGENKVYLSTLSGSTISRKGGYTGQK